MAPGSSACKEAIESRLKYTNYDISMMKAESRGIPVKTSVSQTEKHGVHGVHELLQCPTCEDSMYPPIHQVYVPNLLLKLINFKRLQYETSYFKDT